MEIVGVIRGGRGQKGRERQRQNVEGRREKKKTEGREVRSLT